MHVNWHKIEFAKNSANAAQINSTVLWKSRAQQVSKHIEAGLESLWLKFGAGHDHNVSSNPAEKKVKTLIFVRMELPKDFQAWIQYGSNQASLIFLKVIARSWTINKD